MKALSVKKLPMNSIRSAGNLLARAFHADPILTYFFDHPARRAVALPAFFRSTIFDSWESQHVYMATLQNSLVGVAVWLPPKPTPASTEYRRRADRSQRVARAMFPRGSQQIEQGFQETLKLHPSKPHWYLAFVGVEPGAQGLGIGSRLLRPVLRKADKNGQFCYLETPFKETHAFYRSLDFRLQKKARPFRGAPPLWTMMRNPK